MNYDGYVFGPSGYAASINRYIGMYIGTYKYYWYFRNAVLGAVVGILNYVFWRCGAGCSGAMCLCSHHGQARSMRINDVMWYRHMLRQRILSRSYIGRFV